MWVTFWADIIVAVVASALTSVLAVLIGYSTYRWQVRRQEIAAVEQLVHEINSRRVLIQIEPHRIQRPTGRRDFQHCALSIRYLRDLARATRRDARQDPLTSRVLGRLVATFNLYLENSEVEPERYRFHLMEARKSAIGHGVELTAVLPKVPLIDPGSEAF
jgi:hypothetical protein